ncbi:hypothetical protein GCM10025868_45480 [Angustibacter aerolatus]|uniref:EccD-like transmembrane domain-containing protein n=1 Tax=Angustibacter aerolatus TaxID=1162965 RepID=A0ABQ6JPI4_9ACTN|nr:hypothetical protein [Angustibacter aerolatus]GMA89298.1 hypothetical protein GCM10025868_45480 [Angustibacter aerolatus]
MLIGSAVGPVTAVVLAQTWDDLPGSGDDLPHTVGTALLVLVPGALSGLLLAGVLLLVAVPAVRLLRASDRSSSSAEQLLLIGLTLVVAGVATVLATGAWDAVRAAPIATAMAVSGAAATARWALAAPRA